MSLVETVLHWEMGDRIWFKTPSGEMQAIAEHDGRSRTRNRFLVLVLSIEKHAEIPGNLVFMIQKSAYLELSNQSS